MNEPKIIEGKARRRPPLSKPLALIYIALGLGMLAWAFLTPPYGFGHMFFAAMVAAATAFIIAELMRNLD
jgi:hypothetical protein